MSDSVWYHKIGKTMDLILYHNNCPDGWGAAFICKLKYPEAELVPLNHGLDEKQLGELFDKTKGKDVIMVDFSLRTREQNDYLASNCKSFHVLDHHKTAQAVLEGAHYATFDMKRSGTGLAWDYLFGADSDYHKQLSVRNPCGLDDMPPLERPWWVNYLEDQDLWTWKIADSKIVGPWLAVQPRDFNTWWKLAALAAAPIAEASGVRQYVEYYTRSVVAEAQYGILAVGNVGYKTAVLNIPYAGVSEAGNALVRDHGVDVALLWFERADGKVSFSLRSLREGSNVDVSAIAKGYGGGGHQNAAGFQLELHEARELVDNILFRGKHAPYSRCC